MTMIGIYGTLFPDRQIALIFAPMYPFSADTGIKALGLFDAVGKECLQIVANIIAFFNGTFYLVNILLLFLGMLAGLKFLDHAAHLGGLLFGVLWIRKGVEMVDPMIKQWHELRKNIMARR